MFGQNEIMKKDHGDGQTLRIVKGSPFLTVQGEGPYSGHAAVFIRLHGCHLRCSFCDTNFDDPTDPIINLYDLQRAVKTIQYNAKLAVITGGEPLRQNVVPLAIVLAERLGVKVQIETAGTFWLNGLEQYADIVCSPKTPTIHPMIYERAKAFKYVISTSMQFDGCVPITATQSGARPARLALPRIGAPVYLSPMDEGDEAKNKANRRLVGQLAIEYGVIAGLQVHKFLELD